MTLLSTALGSSSTAGSLLGIDAVLLAGLACVFVALVLVVALVAVLVRRPRGVAVSLAGIDAGATLVITAGVVPSARHSGTP